MKILEEIEEKKSKFIEKTGITPTTLFINEVSVRALWYLAGVKSNAIGEPRYNKIAGLDIIVTTKDIVRVGVTDE